MNVMKTICGDLREADNFMVDMAQKPSRKGWLHAVVPRG
jgi:hypothetical protein